MAAVRAAQLHCHYLWQGNVHWKVEIVGVVLDDGLASWNLLVSPPAALQKALDSALVVREDGILRVEITRLRAQPQQLSMTQPLGSWKAS